MTADQDLARAFVDVADALAADFEVADAMAPLGTWCNRLLDVRDTGVVLADRRGRLGVAASHSPAMNELEDFELRHDQGPCVDCFRSGHLVLSDDVGHDTDRWPLVAPEAAGKGFRALASVPMQHRGEQIGVLDLHLQSAGAAATRDVEIAQALADVATIVFLQHRAAVESQRLSEQLQHALTSRILVEQAKGALAQREGISVGSAFSQLRKYSQDHNQPLVEVAREIVDRCAVLHGTDAAAS